MHMQMHMLVWSYLDSRQNGWIQIPAWRFVCVLKPASSVRVQVARTYSGVNEGREATIFKLLLGKKSLGADITWLSQFAGEAEMLFPPRTHLQVVGEPVLGADGISVVTLRPTTF